jgi:hypothetical protein
MSIIPYRVGSDFARRIDGVISESGLCAEVSVAVRGCVRQITVSDTEARVVLLVGCGDTPESFLVRMSFREGMLHRLLHGDRSLDLARRVETILRMAPGSDIVAELEWLVPDSTGLAATRNCRPFE